MTWTKLGAEFTPQAAELSDAAFRTHVEALTWSNHNLTDLVIRARDVRRFAETQNPDAAVQELATAGWWQDIGDSKFYIGVHFAEWQQNKVQVVNRRQSQAQAQRRSRSHKLGDHSLCLPESKCAVSTVDSSRDSSGESYRDPERNGTERLEVSSDEQNGDEQDDATPRVLAAVVHETEPDPWEVRPKLAPDFFPNTETGRRQRAEYERRHG